MTSGARFMRTKHVLRRCIVLPSHAVARTMHASSSGAWSPGASSLDSPALRVVPWTWHNVLTDPIPDVPQKATALPHYEKVADEAAPVLPSVGSSSRLSVPDEGRLTAGPSPMKASTPPQDVIEPPSMGTWLVLNASASLRPPSTPREGDKEGTAPAPSPPRPPSPNGESQESTASPHLAGDSLAGHGTENGSFPLVRVDTATPRAAAPREGEKPTDDIPEGRNGSLRTPNGLLKDCAWSRPPEEVSLLSVPLAPAPRTFSTGERGPATAGVTARVLSRSSRQCLSRTASRSIADTNTGADSDVVARHARKRSTSARRRGVASAQSYQSGCGGWRTAPTAKFQRTHRRAALTKREGRGRLCMMSMG
jgi:hypothetical protein